MGSLLYSLRAKTLLSSGLSLSEVCMCRVWGSYLYWVPQNTAFCTPQAKMECRVQDSTRRMLVYWRVAKHEVQSIECGVSWSGPQVLMLCPENLQSHISLRTLMSPKIKQGIVLFPTVKLLLASDCSTTQFSTAFPMQHRQPLKSRSFMWDNLLWPYKFLKIYIYLHP